MPALSGLNTKWEVTSKVIIAVTSLSYAILASNDDIGREGVAGAVNTIGIASAGNSIGGGIDGELGGSQGGGRDEDCGDLHFD